MDVNWTIIVLVGMGILVLIVLLVRKNARDKKDLVDTLNNDYKKNSDTKSEVNNEEDKV